MRELVEGQSVTVGASPECDIVVNQPAVSGKHLKITRSGDAFLVEDLGSSNGTTVDGFAFTSHCEARLDSAVAMGSFQTTVHSLLSMAAPAPPAAPRPRPRDPIARASTNPNIPMGEPTGPVQVVTVGDKMLLIGRNHDCDVTIPEGHVSGRHARVFRNCGRIILEDMGSRAGVHVRSSETSEWETYSACVLRPQDQVRIGNQLLQFKREAIAPPSTAGARIDVRDLEVTVISNTTGKPLNLLNGVSFTALPGEVIGIMGPSGSGKTTMLNVIAGFSSPNKGQVLLNGRSIFTAERQFAPGMGMLIGHAPQFDVMHSQLTVDEAVRYSARLRSQADWNEITIEERVGRAISDVDLTPKRHDKIGSHTGGKTLSGGQRKRVGIAMELANGPKVLLLDEPSSGLSSHDTADLMQLIRRLADAGNTVLLTIHQPSYSSFVLMDKILILEAGGFTAYYGPAAKDSFEYFGVTDREPEQLLEQMERKDRSDVAGEWANKFQASDPKKKFVDGPRTALDRKAPPPTPVPAARSPMEVLMTLTERSLRLKLRDPFFLVLCGAVPLLVSLIFAGVMNAGVKDVHEWDASSAEAEHSYLVILTIMTCFFGALSSALEIITESAILTRERRGGVGLVPYMISKAITYAVPSAVFPAIALGVLMLLTGEILEASFFDYWVVLAPAFFASAAAGLLISSLLKSQEVVVVVAVFFAIIQVVFSVFVPLHVAYDEPTMEPKRPAFQVSPGMAAAEPAPDSGPVEPDPGPVEPDHSTWYDMIEVASVPITARWALQGMVAQSDLCLPSGEDDSQVPVTPDSVRFHHHCKIAFYQNHGVEEVAKTDNRENSDHVLKGILVNVLLAGLALLAAGMVLSRRSH